MTTIATPTTYVHRYAVDVEADFSPSAVLGDLRLNESLIGDPRVECCRFRQLVPGDVICALGFKSGGRRRIQAARVIDGVGYVLVKEGWYRWRKVYVHVV